MNVLDLILATVMSDTWTVSIRTRTNTHSALLDITLEMQLSSSC